MGQLALAVARVQKCWRARPEANEGVQRDLKEIEGVRFSQYSEQDDVALVAGPSGARCELRRTYSAKGRKQQLARELREKTETVRAKQVERNNSGVHEGERSKARCEARGLQALVRR
jgi:hypothetical protein